MTAREHRPAGSIEIALGTALRDADTADDVVLRVLSGLRAAGDRRFTPTTSRTSLDPPLPRRFPGRNPGSHSSWAAQPLVPAVREASSIAQNTSSYLRGWHLGNEAVRAARPAAVMAVAAPTQPAAPARSAPPVSPSGMLRLLAERRRATALRLVEVVVQILPARERPRYHEEFRAELSRLDGLRQLGYAARLVLSMFALRRALRQPADTVDSE
ncbi:hypothetical protein [Plantactinospora soyae]|uniref:Uncharacterized protein n=1 Tax=Plantactinospora soyae TaxID=1544732 RepID=A0A927M0K0_9ACTN|nr:hypothetical protein [Plantactinospora soyae]MBE1484655.1 hypothetical protein [Plantactinospora soyae]